jgi:phage/plasmid-like protein (TIGR03299 family)
MTTAIKTKEEQVFEVLEATGLNWTVNKVPLISISENPDLNGLKTDNMGVFRNDNGGHLGTVKQQYVPYQNHELAETIVEASGAIGLDVVRGGHLKGGKLVYLQTELTQEYIGKSPINRYITAINSHNGTTSIGFGSSNTVVVCQNTFYKAYKDIAKFRHSSSASERIKLAIWDLKKAIGMDEKLMHNFKVMAEQPLKDEIVARVLKNCFNIDLDKKEKDVSKQTLSKLEKVNKAVSMEMDLEGRTLWGLFNGVTRYTNHMAVGEKNKQEYIMTGGGYGTNLVAYETIMQWIEENTAELVEVAE